MMSLSGRDGLTGLPSCRLYSVDSVEAVASPFDYVCTI